MFPSAIPFLAFFVQLGKWYRQNERYPLAYGIVNITSDDTARTLFGKLTEASAAMLDSVLPRIKAGTVKRLPKNHSQATYYGGRKPEDDEIDWNMPADTIHNLVKAMAHPNPGTYSFLGQKNVNLAQNINLLIAILAQSCYVAFKSILINNRRLICSHLKK